MFFSIVHTHSDLPVYVTGPDSGSLGGFHAIQTVLDSLAKDDDDKVGPQIRHAVITMITVVGKDVHHFEDITRSWVSNIASRTR